MGSWQLLFVGTRVGIGVFVLGGVVGITVEVDVNIGAVVCVGGTSVSCDTHEFKKTVKRSDTASIFDLMFHLCILIIPSWKQKVDRQVYTC
jgi:hypothetical protein